MTSLMLWGKFFYASHLKTDNKYTSWFHQKKLLLLVCLILHPKTENGWFLNQMNCLINYLLHPISYFQNCTTVFFSFKYLVKRVNRIHFQSNEKKRSLIFSMYCLIQEASYLPSVLSDTTRRLWSPHLSSAMFNKRSSLSTLCTVWHKKPSIYSLYCLKKKVPYLPSVLSDTRSPPSTLCSV